MQTAGTSFKFMDASPSKDIDWAVVIAGHPTVYTGNATYTLPSSGGDLNTGNGFTAATKNYANAPRVDGSKMKGVRPEEGGFTIGSCEIELIDKHTDAHTYLREMTDLASRWSYLEGNQAGTERTLTTAIDADDTSLVLSDTTGLVSNVSVIYIGQEAIRVGTVASSTSITGCTRGYLLTLAQPHAEAVTVYYYMPSLYRRRLLVYKGYQGIPASSWIPGWGGVVDGMNHLPARLVLHARATTWEMYGGRARPRSKALNAPQTRGSVGGLPIRKIVRLGQIIDEANDNNLAGSNEEIALGGDYQLTVRTPIPSPTGLGDGHYVMKVAGGWLGIVNPLVDEYDGTEWSPLGGDTMIEARVVKFSGGGIYPEHDVINFEDEVDFAWSNAMFTATAAPGSDSALLPDFDSLDPIDLLLGFMTSAVGGAVNGDFDVFKRGIGLAIPASLIDIDSFTDVQDQNDYDALIRVLFLFSTATPAIDFFEAELCKPFGWYLATGNDGRIKLVRSKNPTKLHFSQSNNSFTFTLSNAPNHPRTVILPGGVYTRAEVAAALQALMRSATGDTAMQVNHASGSPELFEMSFSGSNDITFTLTDSWRTLGFTAGRTNDANPIAEEAVAQFEDTSSAGDYNVLDENDITDVEPIDSLGSRVAEVWFRCNYDWNAEEFTVIKTFTDAEVANLDGQVEPYEIESKGLIAAFRNSGVKTRSPMAVLLPPASGCEGTLVDVSSSYGIDASNSFASLFCSMLFDRYRGQPVRFKAKLPWKFNRLEVGDNVKISYAIDGVFADYEIGAGQIGVDAPRTTTITRIFEVVSIKPDFSRGRLEAEFLSHRRGD